MIGTFTWLIVTSARNRLVTQLKRVKNPRYAIAMLLGMAYFYFIYFNPSTRVGSTAKPLPLGGAVFGVLLPLGLVLLVAATWIFGAARDALVFTPAEVSMLFSAPVSRRALILYKLGKSQLAVLTSSIIWVILMRRPDQGAEAIMRVVGFWVLISTITFHRLGVALMRASQEQHGAGGWRRSIVPTALFLTVIGLIFGSLWGVKDEMLLLDVRDALALGVKVLTNGWASYALYPFRVAAGPAVAQGAMAWLAAMGPALVLLALHAIWVLRSDAAFEEAAAEQSAKFAVRVEEMRARVGGAGAIPTAKSAKRTLPLSPTGPRAVAILWKNSLYLLRNGQLRFPIFLAVITVVPAFAFAGRSDDAEVVILIISAMLGSMMLLFGPVVLRNDLRNDLLHLPMLKSLPVPGRQIVLAEVASGATIMALSETVLLVAALLANGFQSKHVMPADARLALMIIGPVVLLALNAANFTIHNGIALLFPAWVKLGGQGGGGFEAMGQMMITVIITLVMLALLLLLPAAIGAGTFWVLRGQLSVAFLVTGAVASLLLAAEAYGLIALLGRSFESVEPIHVG